MNWSVIFMYGGAIALGSALAETQAISWVAHTTLGTIQPAPSILFNVAAPPYHYHHRGYEQCCNRRRNATCGTGLCPGSLHINPLIMTYGVAIPAGLAYCMPIGTPPNAIAYSAGYHHISDSLKRGIMLNLLSMIIFILMAKVTPHHAATREIRCVPYLFR